MSKLAVIAVPFLAAVSAVCFSVEPARRYIRRLRGPTAAHRRCRVLLTSWITGKPVQPRLKLAAFQLFLRLLAVIAISTLTVMALPGIASATGREIWVSPSSGPAGTAVTMIGTGWQYEAANGWDVLVVVEGADDTSVFPDSNGDFSVNIVIPTTAQAGELAMSALSSSGSAEIYFTVIQAAVPAPVEQNPIPEPLEQNPMPAPVERNPIPAPIEQNPMPAPVEQDPIPPLEQGPVFNPARVSVPNLVGLSRDDAQRALPQGLWLGTVSGNDGTVVDQQPKAGDLVPSGTQVDLVVSAQGLPAARAVLAVLAVFAALVGLVSLVAGVLRRRNWSESRENWGARAERRQWHSRIRVEATPDLNPRIYLREPDRAASFTVRVEVHSDRGGQSVRESRR